MNEIENLAELLKSSNRILITSHISPDPDAISSLLLLGTTLKKNFNDKSILMVMEEEPRDLDFLSNYQQIDFSKLLDAISQFEPDVFILVDGNSYERASRFDGKKVRQYLASNAVKTVIIDHHEQAGRDQVDVYINHNYPATVEDIYKVCFDYLSLEKPDGYAQLAMTGLYADTGGFAYLKADKHGEVFAFASELVSGGANIELIKSLLSRYSEDDMKIISELTANVAHEDDYSYTYISDETIDKWEKSGKSHADLQKATGFFLDEFIRNIDNRKWGFLVHKNILEGEGIYSVSLRSEADAKDVSLIANQLGGGGHKPAAGARYKAANVEEAIEKVKSVINGAVNGS